MTTAGRSRFNSARSNYTPDSLCDILLGALETDSSAWWNCLNFESFAYADRNALENMQPKERARWLLGRLWNCTDVAPSTTCCDFDLPPGCSFAQLVRALASSL
jgi:hypothetical protein